MCIKTVDFIYVGVKNIRLRRVELLALFNVSQAELGPFVFEVSMPVQVVDTFTVPVQRPVGVVFHRERCPHRLVLKSTTHLAGVPCSVDFTWCNLLHYTTPHLG